MQSFEPVEALKRKEIKMKVRFSKRDGQLPIDHWVVSGSRERWPGREPAAVKYSAEAYAKEYSLLDPRLWLRESPISMRTVSACAAVAAAGISLGVLVDPSAFMLSFVAAVLAVLVLAICFVEGLDGFGGGFDRSRKVAEVDRCGRTVEAAWRNNPEATMEALRVLAKDPEDTTGEAKALAEGIIGRLAKRQRALDEEAREAELAEAEALAELQATYPAPAVIDRSDELALAQLSAELDLQGK